ncbi:MAG: AAA family ATPase [Candidatus Gracilibacteria bacterium]|nr:AAA family ATPase [Candidatus Gracilibacteria bacterium]
MGAKGLNGGGDTPKEKKKDEQEIIFLDYNKLSPEIEDIQTRLNKSVIGQHSAKKQVIDAISRTLVPNPNRKEPICVLLFAGPTGVGKTEMPRALSNILFGGEYGDLKESKISCANYTDKSDLSDLIGSSRGYVGYGDAPRFADINIFKKFNNARKEGTLHPILKDYNDFSIIVFDEIEKASPSLLKLLLSILDDGTLELMSGKETYSDSGNGKKEVLHSQYTNFRNSIIIMTSNLGAKEIQEKLSGKGEMGFSGNNKDNTIIPEKFYKDKFSEEFDHEFIGRLTALVPFNSLTKEELFERLNLEVTRYKKYIGDIIDFSISDSASSFIVNSAYESNLGGRNLIHQFKKEIVTIISKLIGNGEIARIEEKVGKPVSEIIIDLNDDISSLDKYVVNPKFGEKIEKRFTRRVKEQVSELNSDEIILSLKGGSIIETFKEIIIPNIQYLEILYRERDNFIKDFAAEIEEVEKMLLNYGLPKKDLILISNNQHRHRFEELQELFSTFSGIKIWEKTGNENIDSNMRIITKITETFLKYNIYLVNGGATKLEEISEVINKILENAFKRKLNLKETDLMINIIHKEYLNNHSNHRPRMASERREIENNTRKIKETQKEEKKEEVKQLPHKTSGKEKTIDKAIIEKPPVNVTINLNFYNSSEGVNNIKANIQKRANLFQENLNYVLITIKQSLNNEENDNDLVLVFDEVSQILTRELGKLNSNQNAIISSLIQEELKKIEESENKEEN